MNFGWSLLFLSHSATRIKVVAAFWFVNIPETPSMSQRSLQVKNAVLLCILHLKTCSISQSVFEERSRCGFCCSLISRRKSSSCPCGVRCGIKGYMQAYEYVTWPVSHTCNTLMFMGRSTRAACWLHIGESGKKCHYVVWFFDPSSWKLQGGWRELVRTRSLQQKNTAHFSDETCGLLCVFTKDVFVTMLRVWHHHVSDTYLSSLSPLVLVCGVETRWEVCWLKLSRTNSRTGKLQTLSEMWEQENKQDARGPDSEQRGETVPRVCTAACHQRAVKMRRTESWLFF